MSKESKGEALQIAAEQAKAALLRYKQAARDEAPKAPIQRKGRTLYIVRREEK